MRHRSWSSLVYAYTGTLSGESLQALTGKETCRDTTYEVPVTSWFEVEGGGIVRQTDPRKILIASGSARGYRIESDVYPRSDE